MTPQEIIEKCNKSIAQTKELGYDIKTAEVLLMVPGNWGKRDTKKLVRGDKESPRGEIVEDNFDGRGLRVMFKAHEVKEYMEEVLGMLDDGL